MHVTAVIALLLKVSDTVFPNLIVEFRDLPKESRFKTEKPAGAQVDTSGNEFVLIHHHVDLILFLFQSMLKSIYCEFPLGV